MKLSTLLEAIVREDADREAMLAQTVKNPDTDQDITVRTALGYDKNHPARKAAARIYAQFMNKQQPTTSPVAKSPARAFAPDTRVHTPNPDPSTGRTTHYNSPDDVHRDTQNAIDTLSRSPLNPPRDPQADLDAHRNRSRNNLRRRMQFRGMR